MSYQWVWKSLQWRHNDRDVVSHDQPNVYLLKRLFRRWSKKTSRFRVTGLCEGKSPMPGEFSAQWTSNAENVSIWWSHHYYLAMFRQSADALIRKVFRLSRSAFFQINIKEEWFQELQMITTDQNVVVLTAFVSIKSLGQLLKHDIACTTALNGADHKSDFKLTKDSSLL